MKNISSDKHELWWKFCINWDNFVKNEVNFSKIKSDPFILPKLHYYNNNLLIYEKIPWRTLDKLILENKSGLLERWSLIKKLIIDISKEKGIYVIEDASHCFWTSIEWKMLWTFWDIWIFSLQANKPISWWEWWLIVTNDKKLYERSILIWHYERIKYLSWKYLDYKNTWLWFKYRIHPISCLIANYKLKYINFKASLENEAIDYFESKLKDLWFKIIRSKKVKRWPQFWYKLIIDCIDIDKKNNFLLLCKKFSIPIEKEYFSQLDKEKVFLEKYYTVDWLDNIREVYDNLYTLTPINFLDKWKINKIIKDLEYILNIL